MDITFIIDSRLLQFTYSIRICHRLDYRIAFYKRELEFATLWKRVLNKVVFALKGQVRGVITTCSTLYRYTLQPSVPVIYCNCVCVLAPHMPHAGRRRHNCCISRAFCNWGKVGRLSETCIVKKTFSTSFVFSSKLTDVDTVNIIK